MTSTKYTVPNWSSTDWFTITALMLFETIHLLQRWRAQGWGWNFPLPTSRSTPSPFSCHEVYCQKWHSSHKMLFSSPNGQLSGEHFLFVNSIMGKSPIRVAFKHLLRGICLLIVQTYLFSTWDLKRAIKILVFIYFYPMYECHVTEFFMPMNWPCRDFSNKGGTYIYQIIWKFTLEKPLPTSTVFTMNQKCSCYIRPRSLKYLAAIRM